MNDQQKPFDAKSFLAFGVLLALVLLLPVYWKLIGYDTGPKTPPVSEQQAVDTAAVVTRPDTLVAPDTTDHAAAIDSAAGRFPAPSAWTETLVSVSTPRYDAVLSTRGARLVNFVLKDFHYTDPARAKLPVVMIDSLDANAGIGPRFVFGDSSLHLDHAPFEVDGGSLALSEGDSASLRFTTHSQSGSSWSITYTFHGGRYDISTRLLIPEPWKDGIERDLEYGWHGGLWPTEPDVEGDNNNFAAVALMGEEDIEKVNDVDTEHPVVVYGGQTKWAAVRTKYFVCATIPVSHEAEAFRVISKSRPYSTGIGQQPLKEFSAFVRTPIRAGEPIDQTFIVYSGPIDYDLLKQYKVGLEEMVDLGWRWIVRPFALMLLWLFQKLHLLLPNYGLVIIVFALLIKTIFHPLTKKQVTSMRKMQSLGPKMEKLRERLKGDPQRLNQEMMKMYKEAGINPLSGCLPLLPQMPIFYALFQVFNTSIELRGAEFFGWLTDLSQKDPYYILPIIMTVSMFVQQKLSSKDPKQKMLMYLLPLVFGFMFRNFPAGLNLYWTMFNIFSVLEQVWLIGHPSEGETVSANGSVGTGKLLNTKSQ